MAQAPHRLPVIIGPTAGGKSQLAMDLAAALAQSGQPAELISADAYQVYRSMDIGTAKPSAEDRARVPHHLIDIREPAETFTLHDWLKEAQAAITDVRSRGAQPIVVGGTHLYIKALMDGLFEGPEPDPALRAQLETLSSMELRARLEAVDPIAAARIHPNDRRRTIRAIEVHTQTGTPISQLQHQWDAPAGASASGQQPVHLVALDWPAEAINPRINARVRAMLEQGLVDEARTLWEAGSLGPTSREALGYKQLIAHFEGRCSLNEAIEQIKIETRRFAKKQRTWIKRLTGTTAEPHRILRLHGAEQADWLAHLGPVLLGETRPQH